MKVTDLMIGDLVTFKDCQNDVNPTIVKIWQINADGNAFVSIDGNTALDEISIDDEIVGIPLTPEILEKNGLKRYEGTGWWLEDYRFDVHVYEWSNSIFIFHYENLEMQCPHEQVTMSYFHEFQHALRLCGIEKEIIV